MKRYSQLHGVSVEGFFDVVLRRGGSIVRTACFDNGATMAGLNTMLDATFGGGGGYPSLYIGLVKFLNAVNTPTAVPTIGDTLLSNGWLEFEFTEYAAAARPGPLSFTSAQSGRISATAVSFDIEAGGNLQGFFISDNPTKATSSGQSGNLWASAIRTFFTEGKGFITAGSPISNDFVVLNGDELSVSYGVRLTAADS